MSKLIPQLLIAGVLSFSAAAFAGPHGSGGAAGHFLLKERVIEKLSLSEEQVSQIRVLAENYEAVYPRDSRAREEHRASMQALMNAETFDNAAAAELVDAGDERRIATMKLRFDINQVLSDAQQEQLHAFQRKMQKRGKGGSGKR
ncbi:Spy/CpxP family protein refolding chaperone [Gilvimarinus sp. SDUM040013]|uniref:Signaling pathway modulator ZraP n=1 Tax=Gilvimarinus gilvus TaxID=3058038 RepID=A0ABU4S344_9GAMM|nr:Spy/CpxP family protein refolding chaperone [Gilvimarinus sp. SDUM040013]MDO3385180.1 Spy/CpxP family protein refolding chaperone [Gilvimarinus sp. SDUM040013]MDX6851548.1 Spy/CpxP family protein refolding chaperone [Gilvimarinus sp. SDUM040013]